MNVYRIKLNLLLVLLLLCASSQAKSNDYYLESAILLHCVDWLQTREIARNDNYKETNPILKSSPSVGKVDQYMILTGSVMIGLHYFLPVSLKKQFRVFWLINNVVYTAGNFSAGVKLKF